MFAGLIQVFYNWSHLVIKSWLNWRTCLFCVVCPQGRHIRHFWQTCTL